MSIYALAVLLLGDYMFRFIKITFLSLCALMLSAYAAENSQTAPEQGRKVLEVGCEGGFAPFTYIDDKGTLVGFDVDIIRIIGKSLGYDVKITVYPFDGLIPALITDNIDLIISGFTISEERAKKVDFSEPYYLCNLTYLINKENESKYKKYQDLDGTEVCVQLGTSGAMYVKETLPKAKLRQFNSPAETYLELQNHGCSAVINDRPVQDFFLTQSQDKSIISKDVGADHKEYYGIAVNKGNQKLLGEINRGLKLVLENGEFARVSKEWFGYDISSTLK